MTEVVFETHSLSEDNEAGIASGWSHSRLSVRGRELARQLGERRRSDGIAAVFASDLRRAAETAHIAFSETTTPVFLDWRLRECDFGERNAGLADRHARDRQDFLDVPYPGGESWRQAVTRVGRFLEDFPTRWDGTRVLIIGHVATRWALEHHLAGRRLEDLMNEDFHWREGWEYTLDGLPPPDERHEGLTIATMTITLTEVERDYLKSQPLARLATVDGSGAPQNNPVGAFFDEETGDVLIGGQAMGATRKFRNVRANGQVALVVDDLVSTDPWTVRGLEIRGRAVALEDVDPPVPFMSREVIRLTPTWVASWGLDPAAPQGQIRRS